MGDQEYTEGIPLGDFDRLRARSEFTLIVLDGGSPRFQRVLKSLASRYVSADGILYLEDYKSDQDRINAETTRIRAKELMEILWEVGQNLIGANNGDLTIASMVTAKRTEEIVVTDDLEQKLGIFFEFHFTEGGELEINRRLLSPDECLEQLERGAAKNETLENLLNGKPAPKGFAEHIKKEIERKKDDWTSRNDSRTDDSGSKE